MKHTPPDREEGIALVLVLIVLVLTSVLAVEIKSSALLVSKLAKNKRDDFLMQQAMFGQLEVIRQVLLFDQKENQTETLDDRWLDEKYTRFQKGPTEEELASDEPRTEPVSSTEYEITLKVEDEARKFNLHNLEIEDEAQRKMWEEVFLRLLEIYREDFPQLSISRSQAEDLLANLKEWIKRPKTDRGVPRPTTSVENQVLVTPDELLMVKGFDREMFFDQKPEREGEDIVPGLHRYLTLWSEGRINLNTAEPAIVHSLFRDQDRDLADNFLEWRTQEAEEQPEGADPDKPKHNSLATPQQLSDIDGFDADAIQRNDLGAKIVLAGNRFSVDMLGEGPNGLRRQQRFVLERNQVGATTILTEERNDPNPEKDAEEAAE